MVSLLAAFAGVALLWNLSRHANHGVVPVAPPAAAEPPAPPPSVAPAAAPAAPAAVDDPETSARQQAAIARVVSDGRAGLKACYQRALVRDDSLVHGNLTVHVSVAPSGRVARVNVRGPAAFHVLRPCLERTVSKWTFPGAPAPYDAEFPIALQGSE